MQHIFNETSYTIFLKKVNEFNLRPKSFKEINFMKQQFDEIKINNTYLNQYIKDENPNGYDIILIYLFDRLEKNKLNEEIDIEYVKYLYNQTLYKQYIDQIYNEYNTDDLPKNFLTKFNSKFGLNLSNNIMNLKKLKIKLNEITKKQIEYNDMSFTNLNDFNICFNNLSSLLNIQFRILNSFYGLEIEKNKPYIYQYIDFNVLKSIKISAPIFIDKAKLTTDYAFFKNIEIPYNELNIDKDMYIYGNQPDIIMLECYGLNLFRFLIKGDNIILSENSLITNDKTNNRMINNIVKHIEFIKYTNCKEKCIPFNLYNNIFKSMGDITFKTEIYNEFKLTSSDLIQIKKKIIIDLDLIKMNNKKSSLIEIFNIYNKKTNFMETPILMKIKFILNKILRKISNDMRLEYDPEKDIKLFDLLIFLRIIN